MAFNLSKIRDEIASGYKSAPIKLPFSFPRYGGGSAIGSTLGGYDFAGGLDGRWRPRFAGTKQDYATLAGDLWQNSAVAACLNWMITAFPEAVPRLYQMSDDGKPSIASEDPLGVNDLLMSPNDWYDDTVLWAGTLTSFITAGRAYWFVVPDRTGAPRELWYIPHFQVQPLWDNSGKNFITEYLYTGGTTPQKMPVEQVVHFRWGVDLYNIRQGGGPLSSISREVYSDNEATNYGAAILKNMGASGVVISPDYANLPDGMMLDSFDPQEVSDKYEARTTGDKRGKPFVPNYPVKLQYPDNSPEKMALDVIRKYPEARICAVLGIPAMLVGLTSGLERSTYSNYEQAEKAAWQNQMLPTMRVLARQATRQLLWRGGWAKRDADTELRSKYSIQFDTSEVRALQVNKDELHKRAREDFKANLLMRSQALEEIGVDPASDGSDDIFFADIAPPRSGGFDEGFEPGDPDFIQETQLSQPGDTPAPKNGKTPAAQGKKS